MAPCSTESPVELVCVYMCSFVTRIPYQFFTGAQELKDHLSVCCLMLGGIEIKIGIESISCRQWRFRYVGFDGRA